MSKNNGNLFGYGQLIKKKGETFNLVANEAALLTKKSPPTNSNKTPRRSNKYTIKD